MPLGWHTRRRIVLEGSSTDGKPTRPVGKVVFSRQAQTHPPTHVFCFLRVLYYLCPTLLVGCCFAARVLSDRFPQGPTPSSDAESPRLDFSQVCFIVPMLWRLLNGLMRGSQVPLQSTLPGERPRGAPQPYGGSLGSMTPCCFLGGA